MATIKKKLKARIHQNVWGNWNGYLGTRRVIEFGTSSTQSAFHAAQHWLSVQNAELVIPEMVDEHPERTINSEYDDDLDAAATFILNNLVRYRVNHNPRSSTAMSSVIFRQDHNFLARALQSARDEKDITWMK